MPRAAPNDSTSSAAQGTTPSQSSQAVESARPGERRNFLILVAYQVLMRTGWIFKTESTIMPAVADVLDPTGWARGWLPFFNRFGQSVPPLLAARRIKILPQKKWAFVATTSSMTLLFLGMTALFIIPGAKTARLAAYWYLLLYALFFMAIGVNQLAYNTLQGKLIRTTYRGRLLMLADVVGAVTAVACAILLLPRWLPDEAVGGGDPYQDASFGWIFGFSTALFAVASLMSWLLHEEPGPQEEPRRSIAQVFTGAWTTLRDDPNFRRTALVAALFTSSLVLFPHYQAVAREKLGMGPRSLIWFLVAQNIGTGVFSLMTGPIADAWGNRLAIRFLTLLICAAPLLAMLFIGQGDEGRFWFPVVFGMIGLTPVAQKTFNNYTLEIAPSDHHARYLSTLSLCMAAPIFLSPAVGALVTAIGFKAVYYTVTLILLAGWLLSFRLVEPRHTARAPLVETDLT